MHCGPAVFKMAKVLAAPAELRTMTWTSLQRILKAHYAPQSSSLVRRQEFYRRDQREGETISEFVAILREIAAACDFVSLEEAMRDRLVLGLRDLTLQSRLLARPQITFKEALKEASAMEASQKSTATMKKVNKGPQGKRESSVHYEEAEMESEEEEDEDEVHHVGPPSSPQKSRSFQASGKRRRSRKSEDSDERDTVVPRKHVCLPLEPSSSNGSAGQEVQEPLLVRLPVESSSDGTVQQEVQDVEVDPLSDAQPELSGTTSGDDVSQLIPWKTLYNQYLEKDDHALLIIGAILKRYGLTKEHRQCMLGFIQCVAAVRTCHCKDPTAALTCLQHHSLYPKAKVCIARKLPDLDGRKETPAYIRAVMAAIVLFAGGFCDIQELANCLQSPSSSMSLTDTLEILYSAATLLYAMWENEVRISIRLHYSVSYCLYHLENSPGSTPSINDPELPSSGGGFRPISQPTNEQQLILDHRLNPGDRVKIVGSAGTGKSSTLLQYARKWPKLKFLYIVFNKIIKDQLSLFCPENVTCHTFHSLAYDEVGKQYEDELIPDILTNEVDHVLSNPEVSAKEVVQTLKAFFASAHEFLTVEHTVCGKYVTAWKKQIIVEEAEQIWAKMKVQDPTKEKAYYMTHDGYLKLWQLQKPSLSKYNVIMVDEAQDYTPAMMNIVLLQKCAVILVENPHQQIYIFQGADNTVLDVPNSRIFHLTQSLRFGYEIGYICAILDYYRKIRKPTVGNNQDSDVSVEGKVAWLSETNGEVFHKAVNIIYGSSPRIHFVGGIETVGLDIIEDLYNVLHPEQNYELKSTLINKYVAKGLKSIKDFEATGDKQLTLATGILNDYDERVPHLVRRMRQYHVPDPESADYILGTVEEAKGLEFDTVKIDNVLLNSHHYRTWYLDRTDEWNLLYVAVTRAKRRLILPTHFTDFLNKQTKESGLSVRFELSTTLSNTTPPDCVHCGVPIPADPVLILKRINHPFGVDNTERKGFLCSSCARSFGPIAQLTGSSRAQGPARLPETIEVPSEVHILLEDF
ncbi:F-box DNA helicase 1-like [Pituophis catenifer annectens]|uniref:F-box DNA helicase 1-like n=1 Tax=Pituophis catenifer annectens TaxID=94852 RepID=UPI003992C604